MQDRGRRRALISVARLSAPLVATISVSGGGPELVNTAPGSIGQVTETGTTTGTTGTTGTTAGSTTNLTTTARGLDRSRHGGMADHARREVAP